jgi:multiple sugar transport system permease protein
MLGAGQGLVRTLPDQLSAAFTRRKAREPGAKTSRLVPGSSPCRWSRSVAMTNSRLLPYLLIAPSVIFLMLLFIFPLVQTIALAFTDQGGASLGNFRKMAGDINFGISMRNTFLLVAIVIPLQIGLALGMAVMLQKLEKGRDLVLWIWTIPLGVSDLAAGLVWLSILQDRGYLNSALFALGVINEPTSWLSYENPTTLFIGIVLAEIWRATAIVLIILVAGFQLIPKEYFEAAEVFGATGWTRFRKITLPLLKPSLQSALILRTVLAFEVFAVVYALGGRNFPVLVGEAYSWMRDNQNDGVAAAYAMLIMVISLAATLVYIRLLRTKPEAQA